MNVASITAVIENYVDLRRSRMKVLALAVAGAIRAGSLRPIDIAEFMPVETTIKHRRKRLGRWLANENVDPASLAKAVWFKTGARRVRGWRVVAVDWTMNEDYWVLMAAVCMRGRAIPVLWRVMPAKCVGYSQNSIEDSFFDDLKGEMGTRGKWLVVADRGFRRADLIEKLNTEGISHVIRLMDDVWIQARGYEGKLRDWRFAYGTVALNRNVSLRNKNPVQTHLVRVWRNWKGKPSLWYLATNLSEETARGICKLYSCRFWVEEFFRDLKSRLHLRTSRLKDPRKIERILLIAAMVLLILFAVGARALSQEWDVGNVPQGRAEGVWSIVLLGLRYLRASNRRMARVMARLRPLWLPHLAV